MFRFDHDASRQWVGSGCSLMWTTCEPRYCENTPIERGVAPTICWARVSGTCSLALGALWPWGLRIENQMGD